MEKIISGIPGYRVFEYLLVLSPPAELADKILKVKEAFAESFKVDGVRGVRQQLALVTFTQYEMMEEKIVNRLKTIAMGYHPFKVELKDFGSYPSHTIYINVTSKIPIQNLVKTLRQEGQRLMKLNEDNKPHFIMEPHVTIARKLKPWQYEKGWLEYSHKSFTGRFIADGMILLRRPAGEIKYQAVRRFEFENLPVSIKQGELFG